MVMTKNQALLTCIETFKVMQEYHPHLIEVLADVVKRCEDAIAIPESTPLMEWQVDNMAYDVCGVRHDWLYDFVSVVEKWHGIN